MTSSTVRTDEASSPQTERSKSLVSFRVSGSDFHVPASSGAIGGAFGLATLAIELPLSTVIMLRSIADIARSEGQSVADPEVQLACLEVFALGGRGPEDDAAESGYFAVRAALSGAVADAARHIAERGVMGEAAPALRYS